MAWWEPQFTSVDFIRILEVKLSLVMLQPELKRAWWEPKFTLVDFIRILEVKSKQEVGPCNVAARIKKGPGGNKNSP